MSLQDDLLLVECGIPHHDLEHEAVELCLGQLVGALLLHWVLCGDDRVRFCHVVGDAVDAHLALLHHLE